MTPAASRNLAALALLALLAASACGQKLLEADAGTDGGPDAGDAGADGGGPGDESVDDAGVDASAGDDSGDFGPADGGWQLAFAELYLSTDRNGWAEVDPNWAFRPIADHRWRLEAELDEGLVRLRLCADSDCRPALGASGVLLHQRSRVNLVSGSEPATLLCLYRGRYRFDFEDSGRLLEISLPDGEPPASGRLDSDPRGVDNRAAAPELLAALQQDAAAAAAALAAFAYHGGLPLRGGERLHFLVRLQAPGPVYLAGSHNGWDPQAQPLVAAGPAGLFYGSLPVPADHLAYKFVRDDQWFADPGNPSVEWDGIPVAGVGQFNSVLPLPAAARTGGRLLRLDFDSLALGNRRDVFVYLPRAYDSEPQRWFPLLVVQDGNESLTRSHFDAEADAAIASGQAEPVVMALVALADQNQRLDDYTFNTPGSRGHLYRQAVCDELVPWLSGELRLDNDPARRAVMGSSLGGLISYYIGWERFDTFGLVAGMSSSFFWDDGWMIHQVEQDSGPLRPLRFYLDSADVADNFDVTELMAAALQARGYPYWRVTQPGASHDWSFWQQRFGPMLAWLFPGD